jgi:hypothetical protein
MFRGTTSIRQMPGALIPDRSSGGSCNGLSRAGLHSIRISSANTPGDFQRGSAWEAFSPGHSVSGSCRPLTPPSIEVLKYLVMCIIQMTGLVVNVRIIESLPSDSGGGRLRPRSN